MLDLLALSRLFLLRTSLHRGHRFSYVWLAERNHCSQQSAWKQWWHVGISRISCPSRKFSMQMTQELMSYVFSSPNFLRRSKLIISLTFLSFSSLDISDDGCSSRPYMPATYLIPNLLAPEPTLLPWPEFLLSLLPAPELTRIRESCIHISLRILKRHAQQIIEMHKDMNMDWYWSSQLIALPSLSIMMRQDPRDCMYNTRVKK